MNIIDVHSDPPTKPLDELKSGDVFYLPIDPSSYYMVMRDIDCGDQIPCAELNFGTFEELDYDTQVVQVEASLYIRV